MDEAIQNFMAVTGGSIEEAEQFLAITDGNCDLAVEMYLESGGPRSRSPVQGGGGGFNQRIPYEEEVVREPIPQKRDRLYDPGMQVPGIYSQARHRPEIPKSAFETAEPLADDPYGAKRNQLADLFRAPLDVMFTGPFAEAVENAVSQKKFLMINVIDVSEFVSQAQNRDLWRESMVKEIVKSNFIFMQLGAGNPDGKEYLRLYPITNYPHISIIDPRTGERIVSWNVPLTPLEFSTKVTEFLDEWNLEGSGGPSIEPTTRGSKKRTVLEMSEEEQLQAVLAASMQPTKNFSQNDDLTFEHDEEDDSFTTNTTASPLKPPAVVERFQAIEHPEPAADAPGVTRVQIRLKDGKRIVRRILKTDKVRVLYEHLKATVPELQTAEAKDFELMLHTGKSSDKLEQTIEEAGFANAAVNVSY